MTHLINLPEADLYLFGQGKAQRAYLVFGCHKLPETDENGQALYRFAVWAEHARSVSVVGDFNNWDETANPMTEVSPGIYACVIAGLEDGSTYKYCVVGAYGEAQLKADPFAFHSENGLATASKVWDIDGFEWGDADWLEKRANADVLHEPTRHEPI